MVVASGRQPSDNHDIILQKAISMKKWIKQRHSYHQLPTKEMMLEFLLSLCFPGVQESQAFNRRNPISLSQCCRLSITIFERGTPGEKPYPNKQQPNRQEKCVHEIWSNCLGLRDSGSCLSALGHDVAFPKEVSFLILCQKHPFDSAEPSLQLASDADARRRVST